ncbi:F-box/kelch-repeat protein At5g26960 [Ipomoea triloba]|uniref:F-box/kelch-repeat protein At5g26960 n=1 Tax=Ipomoea triloba TaxID=35885 RepID=UPI00125D1D99|nr:F-box/kelch-repeat protein At5g26960 [Ipomoea triloba]
MSSDSCNSRHFSWLMKSCFPNPQHHHHPHGPHPLTPTSAAPLRRQTTISSLPDDLLLECLSRVPHSFLPSLPLVCRRWSELLDSPTFHSLRRRHNLLRVSLFAISISDHSSLSAASLCLNYDSAWKVSEFLHHGSFLPLFSHSRLVAIGRRIYVIGRTAMLRYDAWTGAAVSLPGPVASRKKFASAVVAGKIYVAGGCARSEAVEEYEPETETWRVVSTAPRKRYGCFGASVDGVFYVIGGLKIGSSGNEGLVVPGSRAAKGSDAAHVYASSMDLYDVAASQWLRSRAVPGGGCVVAACAAAGFVFVLSSHAVELSFWKFNGARKSGGFGEWYRIRAPPLPAQVRLDSTVRFSCVAVGEKVVLIQVTGCIDDLLRRSGRTERGLKEGLVLVYDCATGDWSRGVDLPEAIRRAACVSVEY